VDKAPLSDKDKQAYLATMLNSKQGQEWVHGPRWLQEAKIKSSDWAIAVQVQLMQHVHTRAHVLADVQQGPNQQCPFANCKGELGQLGTHAAHGCRQQNCYSSRHDATRNTIIEALKKTLPGAAIDPEPHLRPWAAQLGGLKTTAPNVDLRADLAVVTRIGNKNFFVDITYASASSTNLQRASVEAGVAVQEAERGKKTKYRKFFHHADDKISILAIDALGHIGDEGQRLLVALAKEAGVAGTVADPEGGRRCMLLHKNLRLRISVAARVAMVHNIGVFNRALHVSARHDFRRLSGKKGTGRWGINYDDEAPDVEWVEAIADVNAQVAAIVAGPTKKHGANRLNKVAGSRRLHGQGW
jgi:hypothetical protein